MVARPPPRSRSWSRAIRACPRPSSRRRSWASSGADWRSPSSRCGTRRMPPCTRCTARFGRRCSICPNTCTRNRARAAGMAERAPLADLRGGTAPVAARPAARSGPRTGGGASVRRWCSRTSCPPTSAAVRALPAYARLGRPLCRRAARPAVVRLGARQGHLDHAGLGEGGEARGTAPGRPPAPQRAPRSCARWRRAPR